MSAHHWLPGALREENRKEVMDIFRMIIFYTLIKMSVTQVHKFVLIQRMSLEDMGLILSKLYSIKITN